jgi:hypothetical protein
VDGVEHSLVEPSELEVAGCLAKPCPLEAVNDKLRLLWSGNCSTE